MAYTGGAWRSAMNSRKWYANRPYTPKASVRSGMRHCDGSRSTKGHAGTLPMMSAMPVSRKGGMWVRDTPSEAREAHSAMAPRA